MDPDECDPFAHRTNPRRDGHFYPGEDYARFIGPPAIAVSKTDLEARTKFINESHALPLDLRTIDNMLCL